MAVGQLLSEYKSRVRRHGTSIDGDHCDDTQAYCLAMDRRRTETCRVDWDGLLPFLIEGSNCCS